MSKVYLNSDFAIDEGMDDYNEKQNSISKAAIAIAANSAFGTSAKEIARAMNKAVRLQVPNWSLFVYPIKVDTKAFQLANEYLVSKFGPRTKSNKGGYDNQGYYGVDSQYIHWAWFQCGCGKDIPKFRTLILSFDKVKNIRHLIKKSMSNTDMVNLIKGSDWLLKGFGQTALYTMNAKAIIALGRISFPLRWAAVSGLEDRLKVEDHWENPKIRIRDLNWNSVKEVQSHSRMNMRIKFCPIRTKWYHLHGGFFNFWDVETHGKIPDPTRINRKLLIGLLEESKIKFNFKTIWGVDAEEALPVLAIASIFSSMEEVHRMQKIVVKTIHDLGQFTPYYGVNKQFWKALVMKHPEALAFAGWFPNMDEAGEKPTSLAQLREICAKYHYIGVPNGLQQFAAACNNAKISQREFNEYVQYIERTQVKDAETIPHINITGHDIDLDGDWKMETLQSNDPIGLVLGRLTNCCQHLHGAGAECAKHGYSSQYGSFVVVRYNGKIVAQSWVWRRDDRVVFDSVEALGGAYVEGIAKLYQYASEQIKGKLMIKEVAIGSTFYGITRLVTALLKTGQSGHTRPVDHRGYMDGVDHVLIE